MFADAPEMCSGEHNLEFYELFQDYLKVYENTLTDYLKSIGVTVEELYAEVRETQSEATDPYLKMFIDCLLASADYDSFYKVMVKEGRKFKAAAVKKQVSDGISELRVPSESKGGAGSDEKGGDMRRSDSKSWSEDVGSRDEGKKSEGKERDEK